MPPTKKNFDKGERLSGSRQRKNFSCKIGKRLFRKLLLFINNLIHAFYRFVSKGGHGNQGPWVSGFVG